MWALPGLGSTWEPSFILNLSLYQSVVRLPVYFKWQSCFTLPNRVCVTLWRSILTALKTEITRGRKEADGKTTSWGFSCRLTFLPVRKPRGQPIDFFFQLTKVFVFACVSARSDASVVAVMWYQLPRWRNTDFFFNLSLVWRLGKKRGEPGTRHECNGQAYVKGLGQLLREPSGLCFRCENSVGGRRLCGAGESVVTRTNLCWTLLSQALHMYELLWSPWQPHGRAGFQPDSSTS